MKFSANLKLLPLAAMMTAAFGAQATTTDWVQTQTHAVDTSMAHEDLAVQSAGSVHIAVSLQVRDKAGLDSLSESVVAGKSRPITSAEFMSRFAPTQQHVDAVVGHLRKAGFTNIDVAPNNMLITAEGTAGTARSAFQVVMKQFSVNGREAFAATTDAVVPKELGDIVLGVHGLQNVYMSHTARVQAEDVAAKPLATSVNNAGF